MKFGLKAEPLTSIYQQNISRTKFFMFLYKIFNAYKWKYLILYTLIIKANARHKVIILRVSLINE